MKFADVLTEARKRQARWVAMDYIKTYPGDTHKLTLEYWVYQVTLDWSTPSEPEPQDGFLGQGFIRSGGLFG